MDLQEFKAARRRLEGDFAILQNLRILVGPLGALANGTCGVNLVEDFTKRFSHNYIIQSTSDIYRAEKVLRAKSSLWRQSAAV